MGSWFYSRDFRSTGRLQPGHRQCSAAQRARLRLLPQAGAPVRCHVSEGQEAGRAGCLEMLVFGQPGFQAHSRPPAGSARVLPPGAFGLLFPLPDARHTRILLQNWICQMRSSGLGLEEQTCPGVVVSWRRRLDEAIIQPKINE